MKLKFQKTDIACAVFCFVLVTTIFILIGFIFDSINNGASIKTNFDENAVLFSKRIDETLNNSISLLSMVVGLASIVDRLDNRTMVDFLDTYFNRSRLTILTVIWAEAVCNITNQENILRAEGFHNYSITSANKDFNFLLPLTYIYPRNANISQRGFDLLSDPMHQSSLIIANTNRSVTATPTTFGVKNGTFVGISIYDPVFDWTEKYLKGIVYQNFFIDTFIINSLQDIDNSSLQLSWRDLTNDAQEIFMYQHNCNTTDFGKYSFEKRIDFAGRKWLFQLRNINSLTNTQKITLASVIGFLIIISFIIIIVTILFIRNRQSLKKQKKAAQLLSLVVPEHVAAHLKEHVVTLPGGKTTLKGETLIAQLHRRVGLCFIDICNFTIISSALTPASLVRMLDEFFTIIDEILDRHNEILKIKTIGDAYFAVSGLASIVYPGTSGINDENEIENSTDSRNSSTDATNLLSLIDFCVCVQEKLQEHTFRVVQSQEYIARRDAATGESSTEEARCLAVLDNLFANSNETIKLHVRIGVHVGDIVAGVVGKKQPQYDVWGSACNIAARMESTAQFNQIQVSQQVVDALQSNGYGDLFTLEKHRVSLKGIGKVDAFSLQLDKEEVMSIMLQSKKTETTQTTLEIKID